MAALEFETRLDDDVIHIPDEIATQLAKGAAIRVSIVPLAQPEEKLTPDAAWDAILTFIHQ